MRRFYFMLTTLFVSILFAGCSYDDNDLWNKVNDHEERITALEQWQTATNENITTLQSLIGALQNNDYITDITAFTSPEPGGYTITLSQSGTLTLWNGAKGDTGEAAITPVIGVAEYPADSGVYYWTLDGSFIETDGQKMPVTGAKGNTGDTGAQGPTGTDATDGEDGITPQLRIDATTNYWEASYDDGETWDSLGVKATGANGKGGSIFSDVDNTNAGYVVFTLLDETTTITLPKMGASVVGFDSYDVFYASPGNNAIAITLPPTLQASDIVMLSASIISYSGVATDVQTRAGSDEGWQVAVSKPTFTGGVLDAGSAKVTLTAAPADIKLSETALLTVTLVDANGKRHSVSRPVKYFDGLIVDATAGSLSTVATDASTTRLAIRGGIDGDDFAYIKGTLTALEVLDISMTDATEIPSLVLRYHAAITRVELPATVTKIGANAFRQCPKLTTFDSGNVMSIGNYALMDCESLSKLVLRDELISIGMGAFANTGLSSLEFPKSIRSLGGKVLADCSLLKSVILNEGLQTIPNDMFQGSALVSISIPSTVTTIDDEAFNECSSLTKVFCYATTPPTLGRDVFDSNYTGIRTLYYPSGSDYSSWDASFNASVAL